MVAVHSCRGGTGKTLISTNLAALLALKGKKNCLLATDFRAPSGLSLFGAVQPKYWLNDYLNGCCDTEDLLQDCLYHGLGKENLLSVAYQSWRSMESHAEKLCLTSTD